MGFSYQDEFTIRNRVRYRMTRLKATSSVPISILDASKSSCDYREAHARIAPQTATINIVCSWANYKSYEIGNCIILYLSYYILISV